MNLDKRLQAIYDFLEKDLITADIGCDHGFLGIKYALENNSSVYLIDNKYGPLESCKENVSKFSVKNAFVVLSDGLKNVTHSIQQISICGMGENTIINILNDAKSEGKLENVLSMVLQANNTSEKLRRYLNRNGYMIDNETLIEENKCIYEVLKIKKGTQKLGRIQYKFGPIILKNKNEIFYKKYNDELDFYKNIKSKIPYKIKNIKKIWEINKKIKMLEKELKK